MISPPKRANVVSRSGKKAVTGNVRRRAPRETRSSIAARAGAGIRQRTGTAEYQILPTPDRGRPVRPNGADVKQRHGVNLSADRGEEAITEAAGTSGGRFRMATDD